MHALRIVARHRTTGSSAIWSSSGNPRRRFGRSCWRSRRSMRLPGCCHPRIISARDGW